MNKKHVGVLEAVMKRQDRRPLTCSHPQMLENGRAVEGDEWHSHHSTGGLFIWLLKRCGSELGCVQLKGRDWNDNPFILRNLQLGVENLRMEAKQR